ncbi:MAG TPA: 6-bladed beta-propeller [Gemmatimonadaceae bacterium]|nr:6-bladed beta-propeller [Gemmatimonadaceae bacterium]
MRRVSLILPALLAACTSADAPADARWQGSIDTLASGTVVVHNPAAGIWDSARAWHVREDLRIGSVMDEGPAMFGDVRSVAVDAAGRIYVLDGQAQEIRVFGPDGAYVRTIGRKGGGPGELADAVAVLMRPGRADFWVVDYGNARYMRFDTAGRVLETVHRPFAYSSYPWRGALDTAGHVMEQNIVHATQERPQREVLVRLDGAGAPVDTVDLPTFEPEQLVINNAAGRPMMSRTIPFTPQQVRLIDPRGYVWSAITDRYRIAQQSFAGDTVRIVERDVQPREVTDAEADEMAARINEGADPRLRIDRSRFGTTQRLIWTMLLDDSHHLWVRSDAADSARRGDFDVFDPRGRYLGRADSDVPLFDWIRPQVIGDRLYGVVRDSLDVPFVVRARIDGRAPRR